MFALSDRYVEAVADLDPLEATFAGIGGRDDRLPTLDPDWHEARAELDRRTRRELAALADESEADRLARLVLDERLATELEVHESGHWRRDLNVIASPLQGLLEVVDLADTSTATGRRALAERTEALPDALRGYRESLRAGLDAGDTVAMRQVERGIDQTRARAAHLQHAVAPLVDDPEVGERLRAAADRAAAAYLGLGDWLRDEYAPRARADDAVGVERYRLYQRRFLGADPDPAEAYAWGWSEVHRLRAEMARVGRLVLPDHELPDVLHHLQEESDFAVHGVEAFRDWAQRHVDHMVEVVGRDHVDIAEPIRRCDVRVSPPGGSTAAHYTGPSEDGSRPGVYWQPDLQRDRYPLWGQVTTANHEAVPGHHLQIAQVVLGGAPMSRYQRMLCWISGHGEGWALYAERLCHEAGLLDRPEAVMGYLASSMLRAVRVVIDIGVHCGYPLPDDAPVHAGEPWTWDAAFDLARALTGDSAQEIASEIDRYFGWPGQAPSYKLGEREWLAARDDARSATGAEFDARRFHTEALNLGSLGLDLMRTEVVRAVTR